MSSHEQQPVAQTANRFDRLEWAGAFGDLGTLIPFVVAYITLLKVDPLGILFAFGVAMVAAGFYYRTPFPVQPMKAIGAVATTQAAQSIVITSGAVYASGLVTGLICSCSARRARRKRSPASSAGRSRSASSWGSGSPS
jgi:hypothetical protein